MKYLTKPLFYVLCSQYGDDKNYNFSMGISFSLYFFILITKLIQWVGTAL